MREKVEAQGGVSDPAAGSPARAVFACWGGQGERESPAEILSGALLGAQSKDQLKSKTGNCIKEQSCVRR